MIKSYVLDTTKRILEWKKINSHVQVIPNVVHLNDTGRYSNCQSKSVIFVGRYSYQKDIESLLQIWKLVNQRHPDWQLNIYGGYGEQQELLQSIIHRSGMNVVINQPTTSIFKEHSFISEFDEVIFEGAQGLLLDTDNTEFAPHISASHTGAKAAVDICSEEGIKDIEIAYVTRTYVENLVEYKKCLYLFF